MRTFITVLKNDYKRTLPRLMTIGVITLVTLAAMVLAVYVTGLQKVKGHVALIAEEAQDSLPMDSEYLDITILHKKPPYSDLVKQKYDAFITLDDKGNYQIESLRNQEFKAMLLSLLTNPKVDIKKVSDERGVGVNIIGFMMMFFLLISFSNLFVFADDKEQGQLSRITGTPASFAGYLLAHCIYCMTILLPEYVLILVMKAGGLDIGFSPIQYGVLMVVLAFFGISVALLLNTLISKPDNAMMLGNSIMILTSVLSGSFYSFSKNNDLLNHILTLVPQKQFMDFAQYLQHGKQWSHMETLLYVIVFSVVLFGTSCVLLQKKYVKRV